MRHVSGANIFAGIKGSATATSAGPVELPILYRDGSLLGLGYRVEPTRVRSMLGDLPFEPFTMLGRALILVALFEYRATTIGSYNEIGITILVQRTGTSPSLWRILRDMRKVEEVGLYVTNLPVNSQAALTAGVEIWGYPKYATGIETAFRTDDAQVTLENEFVLTHSRGFGLEMDGLPFITFTLRKNRLIRTVIEVGHRVRFGGASTVRLKIIGDGPTAVTAKTLGLDTVRPAFVFRTDSLTAVLPVGKDLGSIAS